MEKIIKPARLAAIFLIIAALVAVYIIALYKLQIVEGEAYYEQSVNSVVSTKTVAAARGSILDRYGRVLVTNRACNNLLIDANTLFQDDDEDYSRANATILELCTLVGEYGNTYIDELPITRQSPFEYTDMTAIQRERLNAWLAANGLDASASAVDVMAAMRTRYSIDNNYTGEQTRTIAGIRYEINVRYLINTSDYIFAEDVSMDLITTLMERGVSGFTVATSYVREYATGYGAHVLGYIGMMNEREYENYSRLGYKFNAQVGKSGAEYAFEEYLHGTDGEARITSTASGVVTSTVYTQEPEPGNNVYLTLDIGLQEAAENTLNSYISKTNADRQTANDELEKYGGDPKDLQQLITGASIVAVDVSSGEPLAIASWPNYDPSTVLENYAEVSTADNSPLFNRALQGVYAPGSTFKPCVAIAALCEGKIDLTTTIACLGKFTKYEDQGYAPQCWIYSTGVTHGQLNVTRAITVSCNYFFYTLGDYLQITLMANYAAKFGLGQSSGIELVEETGIMASDQYMQEKEGRDMYAGDTLQAAIGQSDSLFTPLQLAEYCATLANGGQRHTASILRSVRSFDYTDTLYDRAPEVLSSIDNADPAYFAAVREGMYGVVNDVEGSAYGVFSGLDYSIAGKTGTAQVGDKSMNNAVFICFAPYENPEIAVAVVVEKGGSGKAVAELARGVTDYYFSFKDHSAAIESENVLLK